MSSQRFDFSYIIWSTLQLADLPADMTKYKALNLLTGNDYNFRVMAINVEGNSAPLETDTTVQIRKLAETLAGT